VDSIKTIIREKKNYSLRYKIQFKIFKGWLFVREYLLGNAAIARGLLEAGIGLAAGYPGTPSSEIIETIVHLKGDLPIHVEWSVNEKAALEVAAGASWTGTRATATMKHVGLNVAADPFMTLAYLGVGAGLLVISADDPYCHSSQNEQDSRRYAQFASIPCLDPANPQEARDMTIYGFELSEKFNIPVMLRPTTRVSHARSDVEAGVAQPACSQRQFIKNPARRVALPGHARSLHIELIHKQAAMEKALEAAPWNKLELKGETGIIASGISGLYAKEAIQDMDLDLSILCIGTYPVPSKLISRLLKHVSKVMVVEELEPVLEEQVERLARIVNPDVVILGKDGSIPRDGELDFLRVRNAVALMQGEAEKNVMLVPAEKILPPRPPALCPGCSHRATYYAMRKAFGKKAIYPSDIGCYTMAVSMGTVDTCLCMGGSITLASGIRFGGETEDICCSLGDSTFLHGGMTGLLNAAYNKARITVTILDNSTTAMTGHQPTPGSGKTVMGEDAKVIQIENIARAVGIDKVITVDPYDLRATTGALREITEYQGPAVLISKRPCPLLIEKGTKRKVKDECNGCGVCTKAFGCPAIAQNGNQAEIDETLCNGCGVCEAVCPFQAIGRKTK
jgi:indolepyruvate ferredoxin oxidoreductase alpha subunit